MKKAKSIVLTVSILLGGCANESPDTAETSAYNRATETLASETAEIAYAESTAGCDSDESTATKESLDRYNSKEGFIWNYLDTLDVIYESGDNYEIFTDDAKTSFYYRVFDNAGYTIDEGYHDWRGRFGFEEIDGMLVLNYGFSGSQWQQRYYDVERKRVSRFFQNPIQISNELVAYFTYMNDEIILIIQNMFDPLIYYKEIRREFSDFVLKNQCSVEFLENDSKMKITYRINPNDDEVTETIDLT